MEHKVVLHTKVFLFYNALSELLQCLGLCNVHPRPSVCAHVPVESHLVESRDTLVGERAIATLRPHASHPTRKFCIVTIAYVEMAVVLAESSKRLNTSVEVILRPPPLLGWR